MGLWKVFQQYKPPETLAEGCLHNAHRKNEVEEGIIATPSVANA
jgi:hypothetical protein